MLTKKTIVKMHVNKVSGAKWTINTKSPQINDSALYTNLIQIIDYWNNI